jgi:hypothetical protein
LTVSEFVFLQHLHHIFHGLHPVPTWPHHNSLWAIIRNKVAARLCNISAELRAAITEVFSPLTPKVPTEVVTKDVATYQACCRSWGCPHTSDGSINCRYGKINK